MRLAPLAAASLVAAVLGGVAVLAVGKATGWISTSTRTKTVIVQQPADSAQLTGQTPSPAPSTKPLSGGFDPAKIYSSRSPGVVTIFSIFGSPSSAAAQAAQGSGFVVSAKGYILTNSHVITNAGQGASPNVNAATRVYVEFQDHDRAPAKIVGWDVFDDVGLLKVEPSAHALQPVPLGDSAKAVVGEPVAAIGSPFGNVDSLSVGVISATRRSINSLTSRFNIVDAIQTDAAINHGNSGGPLFDSRGDVVGINAQIRSDSGTAEGVGFAVPIDLAKRSMAQLIANGRVSYAYVGVLTEDLTPSIAHRFGYPVDHGAVITSVQSHTPASAAGLRGGSHKQTVFGQQFTRGGDVIVAIDRTPVASAEDVVRIVTERLSPGRQVTFTIVRDGRQRRVQVRLVERPGSSG
ncbi:MAG: trypsin-like peptidase domain-containing protein [Gaiellaceae bacterium]